MANEALRIGFVGDVAVPAGCRFPIPEWPGDHPDYLVINLEGAPLGTEAEGTVSRASTARKLVLYNDAKALEDFASAGVRVASLANNHILDAGIALSDTRKRLESYGIAGMGAGADLREAVAPAIMGSDTQPVVFLSFGWTAIECVRATKNRSGTAPLARKLVIERILAERRARPDCSLFVIFHWGYTMERYPHPAHRAIAHAAVDAGADAVIGHHSHCIQGAEEHRGRPILYGLGNWFLPQGTHFGRRIEFPDFANEQLAFLWASNGAHRLAYFQYDPVEQSVGLIATEPFSDRTRLRAYSDFAGVSLEGYDAWFRQRRTNRSALLPVFSVSDGEVLTSLKERWVQGRHAALIASTRYGLAAPLRSLFGRARQPSDRI